MQFGSPAHWASQLLSHELLLVEPAPLSPPRGRQVPLSSCSQTMRELDSWLSSCNAVAQLVGVPMGHSESPQPHSRS